MGTNVVLRPQEYGTRFEICFHDPEAFLDLPAFLIDSDNFIHPHIFKVRAYGIETVITFFFMNDIRVQADDFFRTEFAIFCYFFSVDEPMGVVLVLRALFIVSTVNKPLGAFDLSFSNLSLIVFIFR